MQIGIVHSLLQAAPETEKTLQAIINAADDPDRAHLQQQLDEHRGRRQADAA
jgi:hypothetical protein